MWTKKREGEGFTWRMKDTERADRAGGDGKGTGLARITRGTGLGDERRQGSEENRVPANRRSLWRPWEAKCLSYEGAMEIGWHRMSTDAEKAARRECPAMQPGENGDVMRLSWR